MTESIIELRQQNENTTVIANGNYQCEITPITLRKNDSIQLKQCFIDTISVESGKIIIPKGITTMTFTYCLYLQDQDSCRESATLMKNYYSEAGSYAGPGGKNFILSSQDPGSGVGSVQMCSFSSLLIQDRTSNSRFVRDSIMKGDLVYKDINGTEKPFNFEIVGKTWSTQVDGSVNNNQIYNWGKDSPYHEKPAFGIPCQRNAYGVDTPLRYNGAKNIGEINAHNGKFNFIGVDKSTIDNITSDAVYTPWEFTQTINIPENSALLPSEFCRLLTRELNQTLKPDGTIPANQLIQSHLLQSRANLKTIGQSSHTVGKNDKNPYWVDTSGSYILQYKDDSVANINYLFGSSSFDFGFNIDTNLASIDSIHSSIYTSNVPCIVPMQPNNGFILNKTGGIIIIDCDQKDLLIRGLNLPPTIFTKATGSVTKTLQTLGVVNMTTFNLEDGINTTGASMYADALITKNSDIGDVVASPKITYDVVSPSSTGGILYSNEQGIVSSEVTNIISQVPIGSDSNNGINSDVGYYQIEITSNFGFNKISNNRSSKKISAIVNKYYSSNNFTTGDSSMSTMYTHLQDEPLIISSLDVRILYPSGQAVTPEILQGDNTVFLSLIQTPESVLIQQQESIKK